MCKIVYLTFHRFNTPAKEFCNLLADELRKRKIEVVVKRSFDFFNILRRHKTYGMALAFDFYKDEKTGSGLTLNKNCSNIGRDFAYNLSNEIDSINPAMVWRDFNFVQSNEKEWYRFFNKVSSTTKAIFYLCTRNNPWDWDVYNSSREKIIKKFSDEIVRCLRSDYNTSNYNKRVKAAKIKKYGAIK